MYFLYMFIHIILKQSLFGGHVNFPLLSSLPLVFNRPTIALLPEVMAGRHSKPSSPVSVRTNALLVLNCAMPTWV